MTDHVRKTVEAGVMTLTLARPDKKNALTDAMYGALADALAEAGSDDAVRVVLFAAEGDAFTAGNDINDFMAIAAGAVPVTERNVFRFLHALAAADKPLVAAVSGLAVGIGLTMLLHCDLVFVADDARLSAPFVNLGLSPEAASSLLLPGLIGHRRAFAMFALGEPILGAQAAALGIANAAVPRDEVLLKARAAAAALASRAPGALKATKRLMREAEGLRSTLTAEGEVFAERLRSAEAKEAFSAFLERRPAVF